MYILKIICKNNGCNTKTRFVNVSNPYKKSRMYAAPPAAIPIADPRVKAKKSKVATTSAWTAPPAWGDQAAVYAAAKYTLVFNKEDSKKHGYFLVR